MTRKTMTAVAFSLATLLTVNTASATIFSIDYHDDGVWNSYDDVNQTYSMKFKDDGTKDGFWLVVSSGMNPKTNANEYAVLYGDRETNRITAYNYNGRNNPNSYRNGTLLGTFDNAFVDGGKHDRYGYDMTMFSIDVGAINSAFSDADWDGVQLGEQAGIWFHQTAGTDITYNADGSISNFGFDSQMWLDSAFETTLGRDNSVCDRLTAYYCAAGTAPTGNSGSTPIPGGTAPTPGGGGSVPAPGGLALILMGLAGFGLSRRRK